MKGGKEKHYFGHSLTKARGKILVLLINNTTGRFKLHKRFFRTEATFWKAIKLITGMGPTSGEGFFDAVVRINLSVSAMTRDSREAMIAAVDRRQFFQAVGVKLSETVTPDQIWRNASRAGRAKYAPSPDTKDEFYKSWEWRTLRLKALQEHGRTCQCCGSAPGMKTADGQPVRIVVDHIKPISKFWELRLTRSNLQVLCDECNQGKGNWDQTDFRTPVTPEAPDEWIIEDSGISPEILSQLTDHSSGTLQ